MSIKSVDRLKCSGCHACKAICPEKCISMLMNAEGFLYPEVDESKCIKCNLCEKACQVLDADGNSNILDTYAVVNKNDDCRKNSSSGGVFSLLAEYVLQKDGIVYGAAMSNDCKSAYHIGIESVDDLYKLQGSKYVQSSIGNVYVDIKQALESERNVLFSGTPCQVAGLRKYLSKNYSNLFLIDVICHGVPSEMLLKEYIEYSERKYKSKITEINFRCKRKSWQDYCVLKRDERNREIFTSKNEDAYMKLFLKNYCLRESCYNCCTKEHRYADITLGDFWGIENVASEMNDGNGTSAVIIRTEKGRKMWSQIAEQALICPVTYKDIISYNSAECFSVNRPIQRDTFFEDINNMKFSRLVKKYISPSCKSKIYNMVSASFAAKILKNIKSKIQKSAG